MSAGIRYSRYWVQIVTGVLAVAAVVTVALAKVPARPKVASAASSSSIPTSGRTEAQFQKTRTAFMMRNTPDAYVKYGKHDAKWDGDAGVFLRGCVNRWLGLAGAPSWQDLRRQGSDLMATGCDDPLVQSWYARALSALGEHAAAAEMCEKAIPAFRSMKYPACCARPAALCLLNSRIALGLSDDEQSRLADQAVDACVAALDKSCEASAEDDMVVARIFMDDIESDSMAGHRDRALKAIAALKNVSPYVAKTAEGTCYVQLAWESRGGGWAKDVSDTGWKGFSQYLKQAEKALTAAWKLHPDFPEAPAEMISVAMGGDTGGSTRTWFNRAAKAEVDYLPAYSAYMWSIYPRWGGSHERMYSFGIECVKTMRFDTEVPWQFITALKDIRDDIGGESEYWAGPKTAKYLRILFDGYMKKSAPGNVPWLKSMDAACAWYGGRYSDAKRILDALNDAKVDQHAFTEQFGARYRSARGEISAFGGPQASDVARLDKLIKSGSYDDAERLCRSLIESSASDDYLTGFLNGRMSHISVLRQFDKGGWVDLKPNADFDGWNVTGDWRIDRGGFICATSGARAGLHIVYGADLGSRLEMRGRMEFVETPYSTANAGVYMNMKRRDQQGAMTALAYRFEGAVHCGDHDDYEPMTVKAGVEDIDDFLVQQWDGEVGVSLNGKKAQEMALVQRFDGSGEHLIGVGGDAPYNGCMLRFRDLQVRKLTSKPQ